MSRTQNTDRELEEFLQKSNIQKAFLKTAKDDLLPIFSLYQDLKPDIVLMQLFPNESPKYYLSLIGTVPITYSGKQYNIPVGLHFLDNHPYSGPHCYVKPTPTMRIKSTKHVNENGRIFLPYLTEWNYPKSDTVTLLSVIQFIFQEKCPVFSVNSPSQTQQNTSSQKNPPYPVADAFPSGPSTYPTPYPYANPAMMPQPPTQQYGGYQPPSFGSLTAVPPVGTGYGYNASTIQPAHIRASMISAIEDKLKKRLREKTGEICAEIQSIEANHQDLYAGKKKLEAILSEAETEAKSMEGILAAYKAKKTELENALKLADAGEKKELKPDDAIDAATPLHRQIINCYVQQCAIDDTIYYLGKALNPGAINIQTYLKHIRELSRQQFIAKATLLKARTKAGLPV